jgi:hypothetical protein
MCEALKQELGDQVVVRNTKDALDAGLISNAKLNVGLFKKPSLVVDSIALDENRLDRLESGQPRRISDFVKMVYHGAVKVSEEPVGTELVYRDRLACFPDISHKIFMRRLDGSNPRGRNQIEAKSQIDDGTHHGGLGDLTARMPFFGELQPSERIGFPKVDPRSQPIPIVGAGDEIFSVQEIVSDRLIATVKTQHE